jgi:hypothetical protein
MFARMFMPAALTLLGAIALVIGLRGLVRAQASTGWPAVEGTVVSSSVESGRSSGGRTGRGGGRIYRSDILYEFSVDGTTFNGDRVSYGHINSSNPNRARGVVDRYHPGASVTVYYRPDDPQQCVLEPGITAGAFFLPGIALVFVAIGGSLLVYIPRRAAKKRQGGAEVASGAA